MPEKPLPLKPWQARLVQCGAPPSIIDRKDTRTSAWKPWSLYPPFLGLFACLSTAFLVCIKLLRQRSGRDGGLAFYPADDDIPTTVFIAYNYAPTILTTLFSILWSIVDFDVKRMEPYTQISNSRGHQFPLSLLFLDYAFEPPWKVPYRAYKNRHWTVAVTSTIFLTISIFLAPMQSALLGLTVISKSHEATVSAWPNLPLVSEQSQFFTGETVNQANSIVLHNASLPTFTTENYVISSMSGLTSQGGNSETWKLQARVYWSDRACIDVLDFDLAPEPDNVIGGGIATTTLSWSTANITIPTHATNSTPCALDHWDTKVVDPRTDPGTYTVFNKIARYNATQVIVDAPPAYDTSSCIQFPFITALYALDPSTWDAKNTSLNRYNAVAIAAICKANYNSALGIVSIWSNGSVSAVDISNETQKYTLDKDLLDVDSFEDSISNVFHGPGEATSSADPQHTFFGVNPIMISSVIEANLPEPGSLDRTAFKDAVVKAYKLTFVLSIAKALHNEVSPGSLNETITPNNITAPKAELMLRSL